MNYHLDNIKIKQISVYFWLVITQFTLKVENVKNIAVHLLQSCRCTAFADRVISFGLLVAKAQLETTGALNQLLRCVIGLVCEHLRLAFSSCQRTP